jgi:hypothetical protein
VASYILPTTWRENGAGVFGDLGPVTYRAYVVNGLDSSGFSAEGGIRGGRQKGAKAKAEDFAFTARADWTILPGLLVGGSFYRGSSSQGATTPSDESFDAPVTLYDLHAEWKWRGLQTRGVWSRITIGDVRQINEANELTGDESVGEKLAGWYAEVGYDVLSHCDTKQAVIPYLRYEEFNTQARVPDGFMADPANDRKITTFGFAYKPIPQAVVKVDYQNVEDAAGAGVDQFNIALGYLF